MANYINFEIIGKNNVVLTSISSIFFKPNIDNQRKNLSNLGLACEISISNDSKKLLTCFVRVRVNSDELIISNTFNPDKSFTYPILRPANISVEDKSMQYFSAASDKNKENILVCYSSPLEIIECFIYNINENIFINKNYRIVPCSPNSGTIQTYYFPKNDQFIASCISNHKDYSLLIINGDFSYATLSQNNLGGGCYGAYSFSVIPSTSDGEYSILIQSNCDSGNFIRQYTITENEENCIKYFEEPIDLSLTTDIMLSAIITEETFVETVDNECSLQSCSECSNESLELNKCITCNIEKNYYPIKSEFISQKNGIIEYISCYNEDERPSNYFLNKDYYEECFEYCDKLINCTALIYIDFNIFENNNHYNFFDYIFQNCNNSAIAYFKDRTTLSKINEQFNLENSKYFDIDDKKLYILNCSGDENNELCYESFSSNNNYFLCFQIEDEISENGSLTTNKFYEDIYSFYIFFENNENSTDDNVEMLKKELANGNLDKLIENIIKKGKKKIIYKDGKVIYELSSTDIKNHDDNISSINLGICESKLKYSNDINITDPLLILKVDIYGEGMLIPVIEYEIYNIETKAKLNLNICKNDKIDVSIPVNINENNLYKHNISDDYYNDICYVDDSKIDIILNDRRNEYYINNMSVCEKDCIFKEYEPYTKKVLCECFIKIDFPLISEISINKDKFINDITNISNIINLDIIKCYKIVFTKKGLIKNIGNYILISIIIINMMLLLLFTKKGFKEIKNKVEYIIKNNQRKKKNNNPIRIKNKKKQKKGKKEYMIYFLF